MIGNIMVAFWCENITEDRRSKAWWIVRNERNRNMVGVVESGEVNLRRSAMMTMMKKREDYAERGVGGGSDGQDGWRRNQEMWWWTGSVGVKSKRELEDGREEATTCQSPALIFNAVLLIRANLSACPLGSCCRSRHITITASGLSVCHAICGPVF